MFHFLGRLRYTGRRRGESWRKQLGEEAGEKGKKYKLVNDKLFNRGVRLEASEIRSLRPVTEIGGASWGGIETITKANFDLRSSTTTKIQRKEVKVI